VGWLLPILWLYVVYLLTIAVHEGGHFLAIRRAGYFWRNCYIGPLHLRPIGKPRFSGSLFGGRIEYDAPPRLRSFSKDLWVGLGGILANLALAVTVSLVLAALPKEWQQWDKQGWYLPNIALWSVLAVLGSLLPLKLPQFNSDGLYLYQLCSEHYHKRNDKR